MNLQTGIYATFIVKFNSTILVVLFFELFFVLAFNYIEEVGDETV